MLNRKTGQWALALVLVLCCGRAGQAQGWERTLMPCEVVEAVGADALLVKAEGLGSDVADAILQARKGCVNWIAGTKLLHRDEELQAYAQKREEIFTNLDRYIETAVEGKDGPRGQGLKSKVAAPNNQVKVTIIVQLNRTALSDALVSLGILKADSTPKVTVAVFPSAQAAKDKNALAIKLLLTGFLVDRGWEVLEPPSGSSADKKISASQASLEAGAKVLLTFELVRAQCQEGGVSYIVSIKGIEAATGRMIAASSVVSAPRASAVAGSDLTAAKDAANDAIEKAYQLLDRYRARLARRGNRPD